MNLELRKYDIEGREYLDAINNVHEIMLAIATARSMYTTVIENIKVRKMRTKLIIVILIIGKVCLSQAQYGIEVIDHDAKISGNLALGDSLKANLSIGFNTGKFPSTSRSNIFIGHEAGRGSQDNMNPLIYCEFDNNIIQINGSLNVKDALKLIPQMPPIGS